MEVGLSMREGAAVPEPGGRPQLGDIKVENGVVYVWTGQGWSEPGGVVVRKFDRDERETRA